MKRKYDNPKVKIGDWVYFYCFCNETKYPYKVVRTDKISFSGSSMITVEVGNKKDDFVAGWPDKNIGDGKYWNAAFWTKIKGSSMEIE